MQKETSNCLHLRGLLVWAQNMRWEATKIMEDGAPLVEGLCSKAVEIEQIEWIYAPTK